MVLVDCLEKVYPDQTPRPWQEPAEVSVLLGEPASFQVAYHPPFEPGLAPNVELRAILEGDLAEAATISTVELVPVEVPCFPGHDAGYDRTTPGLYPDLLRPCVEGRLRPVAGQWRALWCDVVVTDPALAGRHQVRLALEADGVRIATFEVRVEVFAIEAPRSQVVMSHWLHADALAEHYGVGVFSQRHWELIEAFMASAARMGVTSLLTPVWSPPLDTAPGRYRTPIQLVQVAATSDGYHFGFDRLHRWLDCLERVGIPGVEVAHLFTQWGAKACPAVYVETGGTVERRFGWDRPSTDPGYREFLEALLPELLAILEARIGRDRVTFHISDEPGAEALDDYTAAKAQVADLLDGWTVIDALSDHEFYTRGVVAVPVVATDAVAPFLADPPPRWWVYYCLGQHVGVANRFIALPSARSRVLGHQLFAAGVDGFLHWGFNFYYSMYAARLIDPFADTCADGHFPGGDAFVVYPGEDGRPLESLRYKTLTQLSWDLRAMELLAQRTSREAVLDLIDPDRTLSFEVVSCDPARLLRARAAINVALAANLLGRR